MRSRYPEGYRQGKEGGGWPAVWRRVAGVVVPGSVVGWVLGRLVWAHSGGGLVRLGVGGKGQDAANYLYFDGVNDIVNFGNDASINDLHAGQFTVDGWVRADGYGGGFAEIICKPGSTSVGWRLLFHAGYAGLTANVFAATRNAESATVTIAPGGIWQYVLMTYDNAGDRKIYLARNGAWVAVYVAQVSALGAVDSDAAQPLTMGNSVALNHDFLGGIGWMRLSSIVRYPVGVAFNPPSRFVPPAVDGGTVELWPVNEGTGATVGASVTTPANDGAITDAIWERG